MATVAEDKEKKQRLDPLDATYSVSVTREQVEAARKKKEPKKKNEKAKAGGRKRRLKNKPFDTKIVREKTYTNQERQTESRKTL